MNLTKVEIVGFKSFQNRTTFTFDSNLIGVVGPNGSGKSNIIDAIRWVLGEQSAKNLRGSSMKDVIFSGTESIKGKNFAEVAVTFSDGSDEREIKRRLYRNGDSDYFIDNNKAKLKDITDLYLDLGINKESYSIITQGRVENIISSKPIDRRIIIEEASGVLKYKNKKRETNVKLEKTNDNILRLNDIFSEISVRYKELSGQKEKTEKYNAYNEELKEKDILINAYNIYNYSNSLEKLKGDKNRLELEKERLEKEQLTLLDDAKKIKSSLAGLDNTYLKYHNEQLSLVKDNEKLKAELNIIEERKNNRNLHGERLEEDRKYLEERKNNLIAKIKESGVQEKELKAKLLTITNEIKLLENNEENSLDLVENKIEQLKDKYYELISEETKLENSISYAKKTRQSNDENLKQLEENVKSFNEKLQEKRTELNKLNDNKKVIAEDIEQLENKLEKQLENNIKLSTEEKALNEQLRKGYDFQNSLTNKKKFLEEQVDNLSFYNLGVKEILSNKQNIAGIHDSVANLIKFDNKYALALDTALSLAQQNVVVKDENVAKLCIEHLKKTNRGRVTFLPLSNIKNKTLASDIYNKIKDEDGFIDIAQNLVTFNKEYSNVISHLLGLIIVVDTLDNANKIARKISFRNRIITLDGQVINAGGSITGGATNNKNNSSIKNKAELDELTNNLEKINSKVIDIEKRLSTIKTLLEQSIEEVGYNKDKKETLVLKIKELSLTAEVVTSEIDNLEVLYEKEQYKLRSYEMENDTYTILKEDEEQLIKVRKLIAEIDEEIKTLNASKNSLRLAKDNVIEQISNLKIEKSTCEETLKYSLSRVENLRHDLEEVELQFDKLNIAKESEQLTEEDEQKILIENSKLIADYEQRLSTLAKLLADLDFEKTGLLKKEQKLYADQETNNDNLKQLLEKIEIVTVNITKLTVKIGENMESLVENYGKTYESVAHLLTREVVSQIESYREDVALLKEKIKNLGNVNLNAIDEFLEIKERYDFYDSQLNDLKVAKESLEQTIKEIDKEVEERFLETFVSVASNFNKIFKELFKGGYASISLENPNDILNTGILIEASPPGKKLQNLSLLSGGEKSLTAISLLFAVLEVKNSPFVILDEVEAALDEVNITRFAQFLKLYSENNQFLIITHRRGTMEVMDKLYGVTMKEKGVSYVLPLNINDIIEKGEYK